MMLCFLFPYLTRSAQVLSLFACGCYVYETYNPMNEVCILCILMGS